MLLFIWPLMILLTLADLLLLVFIAGLMGALIFPALLLGSGLNYWVIRRICSVIKGRGHKEGQTESALQEEELVRLNKAGGTDQSGNQETGPADNNVNEKETPQSFHAIAALSGTWLPCVVGEQSECLFLVSGIVSLANKVLLLTVAVTLAASGLQTHVYKSPFLLFCFNENSTRLTETDVLQCKWSDPERPCRIYEEPNVEPLERRKFFRNKLNNISTLPSLIEALKDEVDKDLKSFELGKIQQRIRICEDDQIEFWFRISLLSGLLVVIVLAAFSTYKLHKLADYQVPKIKLVFF